MADLHPHSADDQPALYRLRLRGHLGAAWEAWFDGMTVVREPDGTTLLTGAVVDQAALHGLLKRIRDLGVPLIAVERVDDAAA